MFLSFSFLDPWGRRGLLAFGVRYMVIAHFVLSVIVEVITTFRLPLRATTRNEIRQMKVVLRQYVYDLSKSSQRSVVPQAPHYCSYISLTIPRSLFPFLVLNHWVRRFKENQPTELSGIAATSFDAYLSRFSRSSFSRLLWVPLRGVPGE